jgi:hypothetical protein
MNATVQFTGALFTRQRMKLLAINPGYHLVFYLVTGAILGAWKQGQSGSAASRD